MYEDAAVAALVLRPDLCDGDVAGVLLPRGELHVGLLVADVDWRIGLVRQQELVFSEPAHLMYTVAHCHGNVAAQLKGLVCLSTHSGRR